ncbi:mRNA-decapping enzyme subunit 2 [Nematocida minor]|uniref:mRNA-decapping enzyme subunit 2 n=1 Tax=Nematocida minor TaxID=1912983 RepID=UPI00221EE4E1|nr:mRNA-decapping enzyme subunit 2 [Nematocida minor]KAI5190068.1 mRNA-decapping enzyme subunit 2 [Nematocida minor]
MKLNEVMDDLSGRFLMYLPLSEVKNTERLFFQVEEAHWFYEDYYRRKFNLPYLNLREFTLRLIKHSDFAKNLTGIDEDFKKFLKYKKIVPVFGALIFNSSMSKVLLVRGFGPKKSFTFPRGKICKSESNVDCAIREVYEEVGYDIRNKLIYNMFMETGSKSKESKLYAVLNVSEQTAFKTKTRNEIKEIKWVSIEFLEKTPDEAFSYVKTYVKEIKNLVKRIEKDKPRLNMKRIKKAFSIE